jgi:hypothetical protein
MFVLLFILNFYVMKMYNLKLFLLSAMILSSTKAVLQNFPVSYMTGNNITTELHEIEVPMEFQTNVIVRNTDHVSEGWITEHVERIQSETKVTKNTDYINFPCQPVEGTRGIHLRLPISTSPPELRRIRLRNTTYSGVLLRDVTRLSYLAFVALTYDNIAPALVLQIDTNMDVKVDLNLTFQPKVQASQNNPCDGIIDYPDVQLNHWQWWNAGEGWWQVGLDVNPPGLPDFFTLAGFLELFPSARILNSTDAEDVHAGGGIRLTVGAEETNGMDFNGFIDQFIIDYFGYYGPAPIHNKVRYDFEPEIMCYAWGGMPNKWLSQD